MKYGKGNNAITLTKSAANYNSYSKTYTDFNNLNAMLKK